MATIYGQLWKERPQSIDELKQTILNVWENVSYNIINALVAEMPQRLIQVIAMNGMTIQHLWNNKGKERKLRECKNIDFLIIKIQSVFCIVFFKKWKDIEKIPLLNLSCSIFLHSTVGLLLTETFLLTWNALSKSGSLKYKYLCISIVCDKNLSKIRISDWY